MKTLERYIFSQLLGPLGFFVLVLTGVMWLLLSLRVIDTVVNNGQGAAVFLELTGLMLPLVMSIVLQLGALGATVYALSRLMNESELVAAFAGGASKMRVAKPFIWFGLFMIALLAIDTMFLMPSAARTMRDRIDEVRSDLVAGLIRDGRFMHPASGVTVYIREVTPNNELLGIFLHVDRDNSTPVTYTAKRGFLTRYEDKPTLVMFEGKAQFLDEKTRQLQLGAFKSFSYDLSPLLESKGARVRKPSERYFWELINPDPEVATTPKARGKFIIEGHEQLSAPLYGLALPLVAAAVMMGAQFTRRGYGKRVAMALILGALLRVIGLAVKSLATPTPELWPLLYAVPILGGGAALWSLSVTRLGSGARSSAAPGTPPDIGQATGNEVAS
ncbi:MAG: LPS export ABC transporter permease LptF [Neomegalonema sp.]|nr:LPS export ABC transporter permease LptF [Neomegalonema sp.]